jgi:ketosteroid isomerase-like protein
MRQKKSLIGMTMAVLLSGSALAAPQASNAELRQQVMETERAFAATMQRRDHAAFTRYLSDEAVFMSEAGILTGKEAVAKGWKPYYDRPAAPFSWEPDTVEVLASGTLAMSSGPVYDPKGNVFARFNSVWRLEAPGVWRNVFDRGTELCDCRKQKP